MHNGLDPTTQVVPNEGDAALYMYQNRNPASARFDVVDLDPYGTATPFLDGAVQSVTNGGACVLSSSKSAQPHCAYPHPLCTTKVCSV